MDGGGGGEAIELKLGLAVGESATGEKEVSALENLAPVLSPRPFLVMGAEPIPTDPEQKKKYHAQRRKEARQKQAEKLLRRGIFRAKSMVIQASPPPPPPSPPPPPISPIAMTEYMAQLRESRFVDRKGKEKEEEAAALYHHCDQRTLASEPQPNHVPLNVRPISVAPPAISPRNLNPNPNPNPNPGVYDMQAALPVMQMHLSYKPVAMVPYGNNYAIPWMVPCWAPLPQKYSPLAIQPLSAIEPYLAEDTFQGEGLNDQDASKSKGKESSLPQ